MKNQKWLVGLPVLLLMLAYYFTPFKEIASFLSAVYGTWLLWDAVKCLNLAKKRGALAEEGDIPDISFTLMFLPLTLLVGTMYLVGLSEHAQVFTIMLLALMLIARTGARQLLEKSEATTTR